MQANEILIRMDAETTAPLMRLARALEEFNRGKAEDGTEACGVLRVGETDIPPHVHCGHCGREAMMIAYPRFKCRVCGYEGRRVEDTNGRVSPFATIIWERP